MNKAEQKRAALVAKIADHVLARGLSGLGVREMAAAAGTSDRMLLYYFPDKEAVTAAVLETIAARMTAMLEAAMAPKPLPFEALEERIATVMEQDAAWPFLSLWLEIVAASARGDALYRRIAERIGRGYLLWVAEQLDSRNKGVESARLLALVEGALVLRAIGLDEAARAARG